MVATELSLGIFGDSGLTDEAVLGRLAWLRDVIGPRLERYLGYYRNPTTELAGVLPCANSTRFAVRPFRQFQELGLPARITGFRRGADGGAAATGAVEIQRKEVVIENDLGWRVNTVVDFAAGRMPTVNSTAPDAKRRGILAGVIGGILEAGGGVMMLQQLVLEGAVSGSAWVRVVPSGELLGKLQEAGSQEPGASRGEGATEGGSVNGHGEGNGGGTDVTAGDRDIASTGASATDGGDTGGTPVPLPEVARWLRLEIVAAARLCPLPGGGRAASGQVPAYAAVMNMEWGKNMPSGAPAPQGMAPRAASILGRLRGWFGAGASAGPGAEEFSFDLFGAGHWQRYVCGVLAEEGENVLGVTPFVRYVNAGDLAAGTCVGPAGSGAVDVGMGEIEPLIGLQDELNTRLSDRAYRVTMTSFRMWLGRGIEDFTKRPVGPGQMWATDNPNGSIEAFGGDANAPSETAHIEEVREALDKISGVPPVAAGVVREKLGNLTSAVALKVTLIALLARTDRKRAALTATMGAVVREVLGILDRAGIFATTAEERGIEVNWPSAMPESDLDQLTEAQAKVALGVPRAVVLAELGYGEVGDDKVSG